jgi:hypothetical protein
MNVNEYGVVFAFSCGFDLSGFTTLSITFTKPDGTALTVANPDVTAPNTDIQTTAGLFPAKKYAHYVFANGDVDQAGEWSARVYYTDGSQHLISDVATFTIDP